MTQHRTDSPPKTFDEYALLGAANAVLGHRERARYDFERAGQDGSDWL